MKTLLSIPFSHQDWKRILLVLRSEYSLLEEKYNEADRKSSTYAELLLEEVIRYKSIADMIQLQLDENERKA